MMINKQYIDCLVGV